MVAEPTRTLVLYDGGCSVCQAFVRWAAARDPHGALEFVPYQDAPSPPMTPDLRHACERAVHVIEPDGTTTRAGMAVLTVLETLGWHVGWARHRPFVWVVEAGYWAVARSRPFLSRFVRD